MLFKYFSIGLSFTNASINNEMKELSNIIPGCWIKVNVSLHLFYQ